MRQPMVAGNWKMNGSSDSVKQLIAGIKAGLGSVNNAEVVVCPPAVYIPAVTADAAGTVIKVGSQNICDQDQGAFTGEIAGSMLNDFGCELPDALRQLAGMVSSLFSVLVRRWMSVNRV